MSVWRSLPVINAVYEAILSLTKGKNESQVNEVDLYPELERMGYKLSPIDVSKALMTLEMYGYIVVESSGRDEKIIRLAKRE